MANICAARLSIPLLIGSFLVCPGAFERGFGGRAIAEPAPVVLQNLTLSAEPYTIRIARLTVSGSDIQAQDLRNLLAGTGGASRSSGGKSTESLPQRLRRLNFSEAIIPELVVERSFGGSRSRLVYKNVRLSHAVSGKIDEVKMSAIALDNRVATNNKSQKVEAHVEGAYGAVGVSDLDLVAIAQVFGESSNDATAPLRTFYTALAIEGFQFRGTTPQGAFILSAGKISSGAVKGRQGPMSLTALLDFLTKHPEMQGVDQTEKKLFFGNLLQMLGAFEFGAGQIEQLAMSVTVDPTKLPPNDANAGAKDATETVDFSVDKIDYGLADANLRVSGLDIAVPRQGSHFRLSSYELNGFSIAPVIDALRTMVREGKLGKQDFEAADPRIFIPRLGSSKIAGLTFEAPDPNGDFGGPLRLDIEQAMSAFAGQISGIPTELNYRLSGFGLDLPAQPKDPSIARLREAGLERLNLSAAVEMKWQEESKELAFNDISFGIEKLGSVAFSGTIGNMPREMFSGPLSTSEILALALTARNARIRVEDQGFLDMALKSAADEQGKSVAEIREAATGNLRSQLEPVLGSGQATGVLADALAKFLTGGRTLIITAKSKNPFGLGVMDFIAAADPREVIEKLDIEATVE